MFTTFAFITLTAKTTAALLTAAKVASVAGTVLVAAQPVADIIRDR